MSPGVNFLETRDAHMGVDLGRGELRVAQQFLHEPEIRTGVEEVRRIGMPQFVRRQVVRQSGEIEITFQHQLHGTHRHTRAVGIAEHGIIRASPTRKFSFEFVQYTHRHLPERTEPFLPSLAEHPRDPRLEIDRTVIEAREFAHPQSSHRGVPSPAGRARR